MSALLLSSRLESPPFNGLYRSGDAIGRRRSPRWPLHVWQASSVGAQLGLLALVPWFANDRDQWGTLWWVRGLTSTAYAVLCIYRLAVLLPVVLSVLAWRQIYRMRQHKASHRLSQFAYRMALSAQRLHLASCAAVLFNAAVFMALVFPLLTLRRGDRASLLYRDIDWRSIGPAIYVSHPALIALQVGNSVVLARLHNGQRRWARFAEQFDQLSLSLNKL